ncbi:MAG: hypothetical protein HC802_12070 [Caldilineaceae bacterium]|nr:hypothetical protein [Caldilineaceae bacterium]
MSATTSRSQAAIGSHASLLMVARASVLCVGLLTVALFLVGAPGAYQRLLLAPEVRGLARFGIDVNNAAAYRLALGFIVILVHARLRLLSSGCQRHDWMVLFMSLALITNGALISAFATVRWPTRICRSGWR